MRQYYVRHKCELTALKDVFEVCGARCYRTRIECGCESRPRADNRRNAVVVTFGGRVILEIIRCCGCANNRNDGQFANRPLAVP